MDDRQLVRMLKALGDDTRFRIVQEIAAAGELTCGEVVDGLHLAQATVSHHLKLLVDAGVLTLRMAGRHHFLSVNHAALGALRDTMGVSLSPQAAAAENARRPARPATR